MFTNYSYPCCLHGVLEEMIKSIWGGGGGGGMVVASMFPASRIVVKLIKSVYNILLLRTLRYGFCK